MDEFIKMTDYELIQYCKKNNIEYLKKNKKVYTKKTLLRNIMKSNISSNGEVCKNIIDDIEIKYTDNIVWVLEQNQDINQNYKQIKDNLYNIVKNCHQLLYSNHAIVGTKAQNDIMKLLTLKILQPQFSNKESELYKKCEQLLANEDISKEHYDKYMSYCTDLSNLIKEQPKSILNNWEFFVRRFLSKILKIIYDSEDIKFNNNDNDTVSNIIVNLSKLTIDDNFIDAFSTSYGDIHEAFRVYGGGKGAKELGQFFTPRHLINAIFNGCGFNDIIKSYNSPTIYDPCMGTGGLLTRAYSNGNILPNNIYGCETEKDTIKFGECSILLTTNEFNSNIQKCDSLCINPYLFNDKFDIIFTNPPFGTKMKYDELEKKYNNYNTLNNPISFKSIYPYKSNNGACLFIQHCIYMLKEKGTCAIILPDGELFSGKTYSKFRKFMCDNINIIKIIKVEGGAFEHTSIKISVIIFQKNGLTKNIEFMEINKDCNEVKSSAIVNINNIVNKNYSFILNDYKKQECKISTKYEIKKLGDICDMSLKGKINSNCITNTGEYPFYKASASNPSGTHNNYCFDGDEYILFVKSGGNALNPLSLSHGIGKVYYVNGKTSGNTEIVKITTKNDNIYLKYLYYYLKNNQLNIQKLAKYSTNLGHINIEQFKDLDIPIPSLEIQEKIIKDIERVFKSIEISKLNITQLKDNAKLYMEYYKNQDLEELNENIEIKKLGDVCEFQNGKGLNKNLFIEGDYYVIGGGQKPIGNHNKYNTEENVILCSSSGAYAGFISKYNKKVWKSDCFSIIPDNNILNNTYLYYYLKNKQDDIYKYQKGNAQPHVYSTDLNDLEIPIPSLENQEIIVKYQELISKKIEEEYKYIEILNILIKNIMSQIK